MKQKSRLQFSKRLLSFLLVALLALTPIISQTTIYAANEDEVSQVEAAAESTDEKDAANTVSVSSMEETQETSASSITETEETKEESDENVQTQEETKEVSLDSSADTDEDSASEDTDTKESSEVSDQTDDAIEAQAATDSEIYGNVSDYAGAWKESNYAAGTYTVTANLSMPGQYNPVLAGVTVYANNPNNPFGPVLDPNDPAENVQNSAPTTPLTSNATLTVSADGTLTLTLPIKNPIFTTQKIGTSSNLAFTAEKLAGPYTYGSNSVDSRIYKLTATLGKTDLSEASVATYIFKGSELYALPLGLSLKPTGDIALQLDVDLSAVTKTLVPEISELTYTGTEQSAIAESELYTVTGGVSKATDAGEYSATLTLTEAAKTAGYVWKNSDTDELTVNWSIGRAALTASYVSESVKANETPELKVEVTGFVNDETAATAADYKAPTVTVPKELEQGQTYDLTPVGGEAKNYSFTYKTGKLTVSEEKNTLAAGTYKITANLTIKGENNQVIPGLQIYPGQKTFPPVVASSMSAKLVVTASGERYITLYFPVYESGSSGAEEIFTLQSIGDGTNIHVTETKRAAGPHAPYGTHTDRILEATFKVDDVCNEYTLGQSVQFPTILMKDMNMQMHLLVDWNSAVRDYAEPEEGTESWTKTYIDEASKVVMTVTTTEKSIGEKLADAVFTVKKETNDIKLAEIKESLTPMYNGNFNFDSYDLALADSDEKEISIYGNTKAEVQFSTDASSTVDIYRSTGTEFSEVSIRQTAEEGKVDCTVTEKLGSFVLVDSGEADRWYSKTYTDSTTDVNTTIHLTNKASMIDLIDCIAYSTKVTEKENGDKEYSFAYASPLEAMMGSNPLDMWDQGQCYVTMDIPAEEGAKYYFVIDDGVRTNIQELQTKTSDGRTIIDIIPKNLEEDGNFYLESLYYKTKGTTGNKTAYVLSTKSEAKIASQPILDGNKCVYTGTAQSGYIKGNDYTVVSGNETETDAGTYTLVVKPQEGYTWFDGSTNEISIEWEIEKASLRVSAEQTTYLAEVGKIPDIKFTVEGFVNGETEETAKDYVEPTVALSEKQLEQLQGSGKRLFPVQLSDASPKNYKFSLVQSIAIYTKMTEWPDNIQTGAVNTYTGTKCQDGIATNTAIYKKQGTSKATDVGTYEETISLNSAYVELGGTWPDGTTDPVEVTWKINPAVLTASYAGETIDVDGTPALKVDVTGFVNNESAETIEGYVAPTVTAPESLEAGKSYELTPDGGTAKNYTFNYVAGTLSVNAKEEPTPTPAPVDPTDELEPGTYQITANVYLPGELNTQLQGVTAYMTNPNNPVGIGGHTGIPNTPVADNAKLVVGKDGSRTIVVDLVNPVFTLQKISSGDNVEVLAAQRDNEIYSGNTGVSRNGRITTLYLKLEDNSGTYQFGDCTEFPTLLETDWNVPLRMGVDFTSAKKLSDDTEIKLPDNSGSQDPTPTVTPAPTAEPNNNNNNNNGGSGTVGGDSNKAENTVTKLKPGTYTVTANIWFNKADTGLPMNPHITSSVFPPKDPVSNNATLVVDSNNHAYVTVPIAIRSKVMTVRSISGLNITDMKKNADGAITSITIDLGILENPDAVITKSCNIDIWMGELAMSISGFDKEHSWPATFQLNLSGVATESGSPSADGIMGNGGLTNGVATGDSTPVVPYVLVLAAAALVITFAVKKKRSSK